MFTAKPMGKGVLEPTDRGIGLMVRRYDDHIVDFRPEIEEMVSRFELIGISCRTSI
jgi:hypothetical protein